MAYSLEFREAVAYSLSCLNERNQASSIRHREIRRVYGMVSKRKLRLPQVFWDKLAHARFRPVARGVQTGAIAPPPPPPLDARSAWQAMNIIHLIVFIALELPVVCMYTARVCIRALSGTGSNTGLTDKVASE